MLPLDFPGLWPRLSRDLLNYALCHADETGGKAPVALAVPSRARSVLVNWLRDRLCISGKLESSHSLGTLLGPAEIELELDPSLIGVADEVHTLSTDTDPVSGISLFDCRGKSELRRTGTHP